MVGVDLPVSFLLCEIQREHRIALFHFKERINLICTFFFRCAWRYCIFVRIWKEKKFIFSPILMYFIILQQFEFLDFARIFHPHEIHKHSSNEESKLCLLLQSSCEYACSRRETVVGFENKKDRDKPVSIYNPDVYLLPYILR